MPSDSGRLTDRDAKRRASKLRKLRRATLDTGKLSDYDIQRAMKRVDRRLKAGTNKLHRGK